jgi:hypothetical protein
VVKLLGHHAVCVREDVHLPNFRGNDRFSPCLVVSLCR